MLHAGHATTAWAIPSGKLTENVAPQEEHGIDLVLSSVSGVGVGKVGVASCGCGGGGAATFSGS